MPNNIVNINPEIFRYTVRTSYLYQAKHINDNYKNMGYNYSGNIIKNTISKEMYANPLLSPLYAWLEALIITWFSQTKMIKKTYSIAHSKNTENIN